MWTLTLADILNLLKFSCKDLWINPPHFVSVFIIQTKSFGEGRSTGLYFFVCFALINICIYIFSIDIYGTLCTIFFVLGTSVGRLLRIDV